MISQIATTEMNIDYVKGAMKVLQWSKRNTTFEQELLQELKRELRVLKRKQKNDRI